VGGKDFHHQGKTENTGGDVDTFEIKGRNADSSGRRGNKKKLRIEGKGRRIPHRRERKEDVLKTNSPSREK